MFNRLSFIIVICILGLCSCLNTYKTHKEKLDFVENYYVDSFRVELPRYAINSSELQIKLDSIIYLAENCSHLKNHNLSYPIFISIISTKNSIFEIKASKNYISNFVIPNDNYLTLGNSNGFGALVYKGYNIKLEGSLNMYVSKNNSTNDNTFNPIIRPSNDTLFFFGYGRRDSKSNDWILENTGWTRNFYTKNNGSFKLVTSDKCNSGIIY